MPDPALVLSEARDALRRGEFEVALAVLDAADPLWRDGPDAAGAARMAYQGLGEVSAVLGEFHRILAHDNDQETLLRARFALGRLIETDLGWWPATGSRQRIWPRPESPRVLHLLKESLPHAESGFTFRSRMTLEAHRRAGWDPVVVTSLGFPETGGPGPAREREVVHGVEHHRLKSPFSPAIREVAYDLVLDEQARATADIMDAIRPTLIQAGTGYRGYDQMLVGVALADAYDLPIVYEVRGFQEQTWTTHVHRSERGEYYRRRRDRENQCFARADRVITIAESMREDIVGRGVDEGKVFVVPNAVDVERFQPRPSDPELRAQLDLGDGPVLGYISNLGWREGVHHLVESMAAIKAAVPGVRCLIVGDGPERGRLEEMVVEGGLEEVVRVTGHVPNDRIEDYYALIDLFVVPRVRDRASDLVTPLKPLEAMAMERTLLVADLPALRELVAPGLRGEVFESEDSQDLAEKAISLLRDERSMRDLAAAAHRWVRSERTLESNIPRYRLALDGLV